MHTHLPEWLWPIALFGGLGAAIDFLLGRVGQERARRFLEGWWIRFDDVRWGNFGREEALFAVSVLDRWCGSRLFSRRRLVFVFCFFYTLSFAGFVFLSIKDKTLIIPNAGTPEENAYAPWAATQIIISILAFAGSISITQLMSRIIIKFIHNNTIVNFAAFGAMLVITYGLLVIWVPIITDIKIISAVFINTFIRQLDTTEVFWDAISKLISTYQQQYHSIVLQYSSNIWFFCIFDPMRLIQSISHEMYQVLAETTVNYQFSPYFFSAAIMGYFANFARIMVAVVFLVSFLFQPLVKQPLSLIWLRIVESDKPIFTLMFGGAASIAEMVAQVAKHL